jgi:hypothetical protein
MKHKRAQLFYDQIEQIINLYGDDDTKKKIEYVKNFLKEYFEVDEFEYTFVEIDRLQVKSLMWLLVSLIIDYEPMKKNPNEQLSKLNGLNNSTSPKMKILEDIGIQEKFKSLEVKDIFLVEEMTPADVEFIEYFLEKTNVDLETEANSKFVISTNQMIYLLRKIMKDYNSFLTNRERFVS